MFAAGLSNVRAFESPLPAVPIATDLSQAVLLKGLPSRRCGVTRNVGLSAGSIEIPKYLV